MMRKAFLSLVVVVLLCLGKAADAQLTIEITGGGAKQIPIAIVPFAGEDQLPGRLTDIIEADLQRSGRFRMQYAGGLNPVPSEPSQVNYADWRNRNADA